MYKPTVNHLKIAAAVVIAAFLCIYFQPRESASKYNYEENRPWSHALLTAPFDITVYRDSATVKTLIDSIDANFTPIFRRDNLASAPLNGAINAAGGLAPATKQQLSQAVGRLYSSGIVDSRTAARIAEGNLKEVKMMVNNMFTTQPTGHFLSQRDAYAYIDSLFHSHPEREAIQTIGISSMLAPNVVEDTIASEKYHDALVQPILAGIGVIQKGERIIDRGDIVTPQLYQILKTYEATLDKITNNDRSRRGNILVGQILFVLIAFGALLIYFHLFSAETLDDFNRMGCVLLLITGFFLFAVGMSSSFTAGLYIVPFTVVAILMVVFFDARTALFTYLITILLASLLASFPLEFFFIESIAGMAAIFSLQELSQRSQLLRAAAIIFGAYCVSYVAVELLSTGSITGFSWGLIGYFAVNAVLTSFSYLLIFIFEKLFGLVSVVTLVELSDINNPTLRALSEECPGTFQHSMAVSNLASEAARRIHANVQLVRAGALYHDIGKISNPAFFTENQHGVNPHDALDPLQSARIVINHVTDGMRRADKAKLPRVLSDFITQHHGRGKARYFYNMYCRNHPDETVDDAPFTYPGPNPQTREASLLMMADTVEAASRSLPEHSVEAITEMVNRLIDAQVKEGLHNESPLSFRDIKLIKQSFIARLRTMYHARVKYPDAPKNAKA